MPNVLALDDLTPFFDRLKKVAAAAAEGERLRRALTQLVEEAQVPRVGAARALRATPRKPGPVRRPPAPSPAVEAVEAPSPPPAQAAEAPEPAAPAPAKPARDGGGELVAEVRDKLYEVFDGRPVLPARLAFWLKKDVELIDAALTYLVQRREARAVGPARRRGYLPVARAMAK